jgi:selenocysteine lyase/cysteine desulfurase
VQATFIPFNEHGFIEPDAIRQAIRPNTKLVIVNHGSNVLGTVQPVAEIGKLCREHNITFAIDSAQTAGVIPIDMQAMNIDVLAFTGHKALMGSTGIGGLCVRKHVEIRHVRAGGTGVRSADPYHLDEYPWRLEFGTPNIVGIAALSAGLDWNEEKGMENIRAHEMHLADRLVTGAKQIKGVRLYCYDSLENHLPTITLNVEGVEASDTGTMLDVDHDIATRTGLHCAPRVHQQLGTDKIKGGVRFSIGAFNTEEHIDAALKALSEISDWATTRRGPKTSAAASGK